MNILSAWITYLIKILVACMYLRLMNDNIISIESLDSDSACSCSNLLQLLQVSGNVLGPSSLGSQREKSLAGQQMLCQAEDSELQL